MILARTRGGVTRLMATPLDTQMADISPLQRLPRSGPDGSADLAVRVRYLRRSRRFATGRMWIGVWVTAFAVVGWLFIAGFAGFNH
jgi:hypothetical protein